MPYIEQGARERIHTEGWDTAETAGELNYIVSVICAAYLKRKGKSYQTMNDIVGVLDNAKDEFRRRIQHDYEDVKRALNGDVYT